MNYLQFTAARADTGAILPRAMATVLLAGTQTLAQLYAYDGSAITNPLKASSVGLVSFAAADGRYDIYIASEDGSYAPPPIVGYQMVDTVGLAAAVRQGAPNLLGNSDFRNGLAGWTVIGTGWQIPTQFYVGPFAQYNAATPAYLYQEIPAQPGIGYSISAEGDPDGAPSCFSVYVDFRDASGNFISASPGISPDSWKRAATTVFVTPANTAKFRVVLAVYDTSAGYTRASRIQVQAGAATNWQPSPFDSVSNAGSGQTGQWVA